MKNKIKFACILWAAITIISSCKKSEQLKSNSEISTKSSKLSGGDGEWDLLGYGIDITRSNLDPNSKSDAPIIDVPRFRIDFPNTRIDITPTSYSYHKDYSGSTAIEYMKEFSKQKSFEIKANGEAGTYKIEGSKAEGPMYNYSGSFTKNSYDQSIIKYSSKYSYASYEVTRVVKRLRFTQDASIELLTQYLTPEFINNLSTMNAEDLVARYGTHVMLDISIGGVLKFNYSGNVVKETDNSKKTEGIKTGFSFGLKKLINISLATDKTLTQIEETSNETQNKVYEGQYYGGTNSGMTLSIDKDGNTSSSINLASFESSINAANAALVDVGKGVFIYNFITDPAKKAAVKTAVENYIASRQIIELGDTPVYGFFNPSTGGHVLTIDVNDYPYAQNGWQNVGVKFYAFKTQMPGTHGVHLMLQNYWAQHIFTIERYVYPYEQNGFTYAGVKFYAHKTQVPGTTPIYTFYSPSAHKNVYTADPNSYPYLQNGWESQGIAFYAYAL